MAENPPTNKAGDKDAPLGADTGISTQGTSPSKAPLQADSSKQYIRSSVDDSALEPDALRGSYHIMKDVDITDDEEERRKKITPEEKK